MKESALYGQIANALGATGLAVVWRNQAGRIQRAGRVIHLAPEGTPDLVGWALRGPRTGCFVGLEVKVPGHRPRPYEAAQDVWRIRIQGAGGIAGVVCSVQEALDLMLREVAH